MSQLAGKLTARVVHDIQIIEPSFSGTKLPHDRFQAFGASLKKIRGVHIIDFLYQTEPP